MKDYLNSLPGDIQKIIRLISKIGTEQNVPVYLVGGFVRDLMIGVNNLDLDIVVEGDGIKFAEDFSSCFGGRLLRHRRFGTATIIQDTLKIDIATARKELYPQPAHLPLVKPGKLKDDLFRRDFTINAMALDISAKGFGQLIDYYHGKEDLEKKIIRVLHDASFIDDPTRILRAIRFGKRYDFKIEPNTLVNLKDAIKRGMLKRVQAQRIRDDLILILKENNPIQQLKSLDRLASFDFLSSNLHVSEKTFKFMQVVQKEINWFKKSFPQRRILDAWLIYFIILIDSLSVASTKKLSRKLALRAGEEKRILAYKQINQKEIQRLSNNNAAPSRIYAFFEPLSYEVIILLKARYKNSQFQEYIKDFFQVYNGMRICISGNDLADLGVMPGPRYKKIFLQVLNAKLNGLIKTKEEELSLIKKLIKLK